MSSRTLSAVGATLALVLLPCPALPCSLCANVRQTPTFRQEMSNPSARLVLFGTLENPQLRGDVAGAGTTDFRIHEVLKSDPAVASALRKKKGDVLVLGSYVPIEDPKNPPRYLLICGTERGEIDPFRAIPLTSSRTLDYIRAALNLASEDAERTLPFFFSYLEDREPQIAADAFMEFARASDKDIGRLARRLNPEPLRRWLRDPRTPDDRLGLYAFLLGSCACQEDDPWFREMLAKPGERLTSAYDGILGGYIQLRTQEGWETAEKVLREGKQPLLVRLAVVRMLSFYMGWAPAESRGPVFRCLAGMLAQGEFVDLAVEDLRRWKMWELTDQVLALYGRKGLDAPIHRRAIIRYALSCPKPAAGGFLAGLREREGDLVREVENGLRAIDGR